MLNPSQITPLPSPQPTLPIPSRDPAPALRRAVFLDRDGTLNVERAYLARPEQLALLPGAAAALRQFQTLGLLRILVTNQSGIARGYFSTADLAAVHARLHDQLAAENSSLTGVYVCPHGPDDGCGCRKPQPGLALTAAHEHQIDPSRSFVIGDKRADMQLGRAIGARTILVETGYGTETASAGCPEADAIAPDLLTAARLVAGWMTHPA